MNPFAVKTKNQNLLKTKVKTFQDTYQQSENRVRTTSSLSNLAHQLYSSSHNKSFKNQLNNSKLASSKKSRPSSAKKSHQNPEFFGADTILSKTMSTAMNGLSLRASHISGFAEMNTELLREKKEVQQKIAFLKQKIVKEKKALNTAEYNCKRNKNEIDSVFKFYSEAHSKSEKLQEQISLVEEQNAALRKNIKEIKGKALQRKNHAANERNLVKTTNQKVKLLKHSVLDNEKQRNYVKGDLAKHQRIMTSSSIYSKQLEEEKAMLMLEINQTVKAFKI